MLEQRLDGYDVTAVPDVGRADGGPLRLVWVRPRSAFSLASHGLAEPGAGERGGGPGAESVEAGAEAGAGVDAGEGEGEPAALTLLDAYRVHWVPVAS